MAAYNVQEEVLNTEQRKILRRKIEDLMRKNKPFCEFMIAAAVNKEYGTIKTNDIVSHDELEAIKEGNFRIRRTQC